MVRKDPLHLIQVFKFAIKIYPSLILRKVQICLQLGIRSKFRNKWRAENSTDKIEAICAEALTYRQAVWESGGTMQKNGAKGEYPNLFKG